MQKRRELTSPEIEAISADIVKQFALLDLTGIKFLHIFYPIAGKQEFNSLLLVDWLKAKHPAIQLVLPKVKPEYHELVNILWQSDTPLAMNSWGITEPENGIEIAATEIDMVIIPLLAYDKFGNRLGYGKGFYDRFLAGCKASVQKVGVSFFAPEEQFQETNAYDIPLDICVTPTKIWNFKQ